MIQDKKGIFFLIVVQFRGYPTKVNPVKSG
jgi:hypothetical protein